jgi:3-methyladenine DNA glycosylase AlkC
MMAQMLAWAKHDSEDVRRLASEGSRPRLPWGISIPALKRDPSPILPILDTLRHDPSETVRRSVANNLNDISRDHPELTIDVLRRWQDGTPDVSEITHHALRTLIKQGHPEALNLLGYSHGAEVTVRNLRVEPATIPMGGEVRFSFDIVSTGQTAQELMIDYVVCFMKANGKQNPKVFKLAKRTISPGESMAISRTQSFRPITTRKYYPGDHSIAPKINGQVYDAVSFVVTGEG